MTILRFDEALMRETITTMQSEAEYLETVINRLQILQQKFDDDDIASLPEPVRYQTQYRQENIHENITNLIRSAIFIREKLQEHSKQIQTELDAMLDAASGSRSHFK